MFSQVLGDMKVLRLMQDFMTERYHMAIVADVEEKVTLLFPFFNQ